ncbi:MAG: TlpA family protein disulfide reductase [Acidobacteria bacterium]|nr:TlpA family protein disulfide reductase [Acidobacteriota bacterium]
MKALAIKLLLVAAVVLAAACGADEGTPEDVVVGNVAPNFSLRSLDGATVKSASLKGTPVVLNFWATWCQVCRTEIPELQKLATDPKVKVVSIALDEDGASIVKPFVADHGINYTVLLGDQEVFQRFNGFNIPYTLVLDSSGRIVKIYRSVATKEELENDIRAIAKASGGGEPETATRSERADAPVER